MRLLAACEVSGEVRRAFRERGHDAWSCDLLPASDGSEHHIQVDNDTHLADILYDRRRRWDRVIAFPPCTFICGSGLHWNNRGRGWAKTEEALQFVCMILNAPIDEIALENPVGCISTRLAQLVTGGQWVVKPHDGRITCPPSQTIQPYHFGEDASKRTCLWLKNLPKLKPTQYVEPRIVNGKKRWGNQTDSGQNKLAPSKDRGAIRAVTYPGIARAMAEQWG